MHPKERNGTFHLPKCLFLSTVGFVGILRLLGISKDVCSRGLKQMEGTFRLTCRKRGAEASERAEKHDSSMQSVWVFASIFGQRAILGHMACQKKGALSMNDQQPEAPEAADGRKEHAALCTGLLQV